MGHKPAYVASIGRSHGHACYGHRGRRRRRRIRHESGGGGQLGCRVGRSSCRGGRVLARFVGRESSTVRGAGPWEKTRSEPKVLNHGELVEDLYQVHPEQASLDFGPCGHRAADIVEHGRVLCERPGLDLEYERNSLAVEIGGSVVLCSVLVLQILGHDRGGAIVGPLRTAQNVNEVEVVVETPHAVRTSRLQRVGADELANEGIVAIKHVEKVRARERVSPCAQHVKGAHHGKERELVARAVVQALAGAKRIPEIVLQLHNAGAPARGYELV